MVVSECIKTGHLRATLLNPYHSVAITINVHSSATSRRNVVVSIHTQSNPFPFLLSVKRANWSVKLRLHEAATVEFDLITAGVLGLLWRSFRYCLCSVMHTGPQQIERDCGFYFGTFAANPLHAAGVGIQEANLYICLLLPLIWRKQRTCWLNRNRLEYSWWHCLTRE